MTPTPNSGEPNDGVPAEEPGVAGELIAAFDRHARVNEFLVGALEGEVWHAPPPQGEGGSIAGIVVHMLGTQRRFAALGAGDASVPPALDDDLTPDAARRAFRACREALTAAFRGALERGEPTAGAMPRRVVDMVTYLMQHDAHHRGQIARQARELGHALSRDDAVRMFGWKDLPED